MPSRLVAYKLSDRTRDIAKDLDTLDAAGNFEPEAVTGDSSTFWISDTKAWRAFAYDRSGSSFPLHADNSTPRGVWGTNAVPQETTVYVVDNGTTKKVFAYDFLSATRQTAKEFNLHSTNTNPAGCWGDGIYLYVVDASADKVFVYQLSNGARQSTLEWNTTDATTPYGIWGDYQNFYITDTTSRTIIAYNATDKTRNASRDFDLGLADSNFVPRGLYGNGFNLWVCHDRTVNSVVESRIDAFNFGTRTEQATRSFTNNTLVASGLNAPQDCWVTNNLMFVTNQSTNRLYLYAIFGRAGFNWERHTPNPIGETARWNAEGGAGLRTAFYSGSKGRLRVSPTPANGVIPTYTGTPPLFIPGTWSIQQGTGTKLEGPLIVATASETVIELIIDTAVNFQNAFGSSDISSGSQWILRRES